MSLDSVEVVFVKIAAELENKGLLNRKKLIENLENNICSDLNYAGKLLCQLWDSKMDLAARKQSLILLKQSSNDHERKPNFPRLLKSLKLMGFGAASLLSVLALSYMAPEKYKNASLKDIPLPNFGLKNLITNSDTYNTLKNSSLGWKIQNFADKVKSSDTMKYMDTKKDQMLNVKLSDVGPKLMQTTLSDSKPFVQAIANDMTPISEKLSNYELFNSINSDVKKILKKIPDSVLHTSLTDVVKKVPNFSINSFR